jgi:hypothetical protein
VSVCVSVCVSMGMCVKYESVRLLVCVYVHVLVSSQNLHS